MYLCIFDVSIVIASFMLYTYKKDTFSIYFCLTLSYTRKQEKGYKDTCIQC